MQLPDLERAMVDELRVEWLEKKGIKADVLRLDTIHSVVSGNKWFKLKEYLKKAAAEERKTIITFGGAWSNHIQATAAACQAAGFHCVGIIRGERPERLSPTLDDAQQMGMELHFISREQYKGKQ